MFGEQGGEALLGEYAGEARLIQEFDATEIGDYQVVLICERSAAVLRLVPDVAEDLTVIDLVGGLPDSAGATLLNPASDPAESTAGCWTVPHPLSLVLYDLLRPVDCGPGVDEAVAVVLRPAADYGEAGVEELRQQTVHLLNCIEMPVETFGRQLAFNIVPDPGLSCAVPGLEQEIPRQVSRMLGWDRERLTLRFLAAPVFHGHGIELRLRTSNGAELDDVQRAFAESGLTPEQGGGRLISTPLEVANECAIKLGELSADGLGGFWLWAVAGRSGRRAAKMAVDVVRRAIGS
jgi:aspartate-semialdehyde dehydrogenase